MASHLWLDHLDDALVSTMAVAFTLSAKKRGGRVSTERFLAALPFDRKTQMAKLCADAKSDCKMSVSATDLPAPDLPANWQDLICFSTCIETALLKCTPGTDLVAFLKLLCANAVRLHAVADRNLDVDSYLTTSARDPSTVGPPTPAPDRWQTHPTTLLSSSVDDLLSEDVLQLVLSKASSVEHLRKCKAVCKSWQHAARVTLCDVDWLCANQISLHEILKKGRPSPQLVRNLAAKRPECMQERDGEGLLPLQYAAAYRMDAGLVATLREATVSQVPGSAWANSAEARSIKSQLRPVSTRIVRGPISA